MVPYFKFPQGEIKGLQESKKLVEDENQKLLERICALEDKQVCNQCDDDDDDDHVDNNNNNNL